MLDAAGGARTAAGHAHVDERDVRQLLAGDLNRLLGIRDAACELELRLGANDARENLANALVVLGDQHADSAMGFHYL